MKTENNPDLNNSLPSKVPTEEIFLVPPGYFENAQATILAEVRSASIPLIPWPRYLVAASITAGLFICSYFLFRSNHDTFGDELSQEEIAYGIHLEGIDQDLLVSHMVESDLALAGGEEEHAAIQEYLIENQIDINHIHIE
jgi:hypothetical protein